MHILHIYKDYYPVLGGIENHVKELAEALAARGHRVTVLVTALGRRTRVERQGRLRVIKAARLATVASTPLSLALLRHLHLQKPEIVHLHFPYPFGEVGHLLLGRGRRTVMTYHSDVVRQAAIMRLYAPLMRRILRGVDRIIATSPQYIASSPYLAQLSDRCTVIPLGIDVTRFLRADPVRIAAIRKRYPLPLLLFVGKLRYYKGINYLLEAMTHIQATLLVIGGGPQEYTLKARARKLGLGDRVFFLGEMPDSELPAYYHACDLFILPSCERSEAFGIVLVEAMASGKPILSTKLETGTSFVNQDGVTGRVVPPRDPEALRRAVSDLLGDRELSRKMGAAAKARALEEFTLPRMVGRIEALYEQLLCREPRRHP